jgi:hypothetical protein
VQFLPLILSAQNYHPILRESNSWNVMWGECDASHVESIFSINDSVVDTKIFATLYEHPTNKIGTLEEDTLLGTLTFHENSGKSYLVFDISLVPGDILSFIGKFDNPIDLIVSDTITIGGLKYIEFTEAIYMCSYESKFVMIESVGPNVGIHKVGSYFNSSFNNYLLCTFKSGNFYFGNELFANNCEVEGWIGIERQIDSNKIRISQSDNSLFIWNYFNSGKIMIYSMQGSILHEQILNSDTNSISLEKVKSGVYIYVIQTDDGLVSGKFIRY